ncbi:MAG: outer membrane protein assembly factor BamD [Thermodesulfobacteriota bacterium]
MKKIFLVLIILAITSGCGLFHKDTEKTATELLAEARIEYQDEDYRDAIELFQQLINWYPFSKHVTEAEIKIADAYFEMEKYNEAIRAYNSFERLHPLNPEAEKASFRIAQSFYKQVYSIDRDQTNTREALKHFNRFLKSYPDSKYSKKAEEKAKDCIRRLADSELYVGNFYFKQEAFEAAEQRFNNIIKNYPETDAAEKAEEKLKQIANKKEKKADDE